LNWAQNPSQMNAKNMNNIRGEPNICFRNKKEIVKRQMNNSKRRVPVPTRISKTFIDVYTNLRRVARQELSW
jgi:hypothetical protein